MCWSDVSLRALVFVRNGSSSVIFFIVANMVAEAASGSRSPKEAAERAQKRAERYYKV